MAGPSMTDVARHAGVAQATVSNVLNHPSRVRPATIERVQRSIQELGFVPNMNARALASGRNRSIGLVLSGLDHSFAIDTARGAQEAALANGYQLLVTSADNDRQLESDHLDFFVGANVAGILLTPLVESQGALAQHSDNGVPTVILNFHSDDGAHCYVATDNEAVGYLAANHLIATGRRRLAVVTATSLQPVVERLRGIRRAIREHGGSVSLQEIVVADHSTSRDGIVVGHNLAARGVDVCPDGVIGVTDLLASGVIQGLTEAGFRVPGDVAVMGCDANNFAWGATMPLTTVDGGCAARAAAGVELLLEEADLAPGQHHVHRTVIIEPQLQIRASTFATASVASSA